MKVLLLCPHADDEIGTLPLYFAYQKKQPSVGCKIVSFSACETTAVALKCPPNAFREEEKSALQAIGFPLQDCVFDHFPVRRFSEHRQEILEKMVSIRQSFHPDIVVCPCTKDLHQDHQVICAEACRCFKTSTIFGYIYPWNCFSDPANVYVEIDDSIVQKMLSFISVYSSQREKFYMQESYLRSLLTVTGAKVSKPFAVGYEGIQIVL
ncbi:MAG: PIG-L family deacetylase [Opitutales bacterium]|nr:PIG-L family deacetylase [Opitutales bacterium]